MIIKIWGVKCDGTPIGNVTNWSCRECNGKGYRAVSLDELIKPTNNPEYQYDHNLHIKSCLNLELLQ